MRRRPALLVSGIVGITVILCAPGIAQQGGPFGPARFQGALDEPFTGISSDGSVLSGLFEIERTGVPTTAVRQAAEGLLAALDEERRTRLRFDVMDSEWRNWANIHRFERQGVSLEEMNADQREAAYELLRTSLSARGYQTSRDIMRLNHHLAELIDNFDEYGEHLYWFSLMGTPSADQPWGWQLDGHHLIINYFVLGDQVVMTPTFLGSEPVYAESGRYAGTRIMEAEQSLALQLVQSLDASQRAAAVIEANKRRGENLTEMFRDNVTVPFEGLVATRLNDSQRARLLDLIGLYVGNMDDGHARVRMDEIGAHLDSTYFAWKGGTGDDAVFYFRVHSPVLLIEFDHQGPTALDGDRSVATRRHVHSVMRTPNGNDYGKDLLRQHYAAHRGDPEHVHVAELR